MDPGPTVRALLPTGAPALERAVAAQTRPPASAAGVAAVLADAAGSAGDEAEWLWLLDGSALPRPDALERLLAAIDRAPSSPACALLTAKVVDAGGELVVAQAPWYRRGEPDLAMRAAVGRIVPIRAARGGCLLVRRDAAEAAGAPLAGLRGPGAALEWSARLLRRRGGYLVPAAVATVLDDDGTAGRERVEDLHAGAAMLVGPAVTIRERLWLAPEVVGLARTARRRSGGSRTAIAAAGATGALAAIRGRAAGRARTRP